MDAQVEAALDDAIEFARQSPLPRAEDALTDAYATVISGGSAS
jgi:TPP-dependent pyruvate/acetoin dehydrogenase alpha subunit